MDDFNMHTLYESKNEWSARLVNILTPVIVDGYKSMLQEAITLCKNNNEMEKYLMTFQNFISRVPKWNATIIENERKRITEISGCNYLEDLITCVHVIQLKVLTAMRVGQKQKKIDIQVPKLDDFIHKVYINSARKIYKNVYLFESVHVSPLNIQRNERELEKLIQECILNTIRDGIPLEEILKAYMAETEEEIVEPETPASASLDSTTASASASASASLENLEDASSSSSSSSSGPVLRFNDVDMLRDENNNESVVNVPKSLEEIEKRQTQQAAASNLDEDAPFESKDFPMAFGSDLSDEIPELDVELLD